MLIEPEAKFVSIVLLGSFNPTIFNPDWLFRNELITEAEFDTSQVEFVHPQISHIRTDWLDLQVEPERLVARTSEIPIQLRDLVFRVFGEKLPHTPIRMMGINLEVHFSVGSAEERTRIGQLLAPPDIWGEWSKGIRAGDGKSQGGLRSLSIQQSVFDWDRPNGFVVATVEPSNLIKKFSGIMMRVNDHYEVQNVKEVADASEITGHLASEFDRSLKQSEKIINIVMGLKQ